MIMNDLKIVIVGHVDHGKSTLIGRLLYDTGSLPEEKMQEIRKTCEMLGKDIEFAYIMDNLQEEIEQNITIDTAQTFFETKKRKYVIIDAPGHKEFVKNMITGASQADAAILLIDAKEGVKEQTKRHAYILSMLGLGQVIVAINKIDLVNYDKNVFDSIKKEIQAFLASIGITPSHIIPISSKHGDNLAKKSDKMPWYTGMTVLESLDAFDNKETTFQKPLRMPVQDVYKFDDKRILVGRVESGMIKKCQEVMFFPSKKKTKIKSIEVYGENPTEAEPGKSIGVTLEDPLFIERGEVIASADNQPKVTDEVEANIFWMSPKSLDISDELIFKCATQETACKVEKIMKKIDSSDLSVKGENASSLEETEVGYVIIKTENPVAIDNFNEIEELGRFVLVSGYDVVAGGIINKAK